MSDSTHPIAVVGGGLAGLVAAATLAEHVPVALFEASALGGRARSASIDGAVLNLGPHALYRAGVARDALRELGLPVRGASPPVAALGLWGERTGPLPFTPLAAASTPLLTPTERLALARFVAGIALRRPASLAGRTVASWLGEQPEAVAAVAGALVRVSSYAADFARMDAGAALAQLQRAMRGVDYLDGGWQRLVHGLVSVCRARGVQLHAHTPVRRASATEIRTDAGSLSVRGAVLALSPRRALAIAAHPALERAVAEAVPVRAACLDLVLDGPIDPRRRFALGVDRPLYIAEHSSVAALAPEGQSVVHAAVYGARDREGGRDPALLRAELEAALDRVLGDWRARVVHARFLPAMTVSHDLPRAAGRRVSGELAPGLWAAGDWVDSDYLLADAAVASALAACRGLLRERAVA